MSIGFVALGQNDASLKDGRGGGGGRGLSDLWYPDEGIDKCSGIEIEIFFLYHFM